MTKWVDRDAKDKDVLKKELKELENLIRRAGHIHGGNGVEDMLLVAQGKLYDCIKFVRGDKKDG